MFHQVKNKKVSRSPNLNVHIIFHLVCTLNCSNNNPSSKRPVACELLQTEKKFWSNNIILYYEQDYFGTECHFTKTDEEINKFKDLKFY